MCTATLPNASNPFMCNLIWIFLLTVLYLYYSLSLSGVDKELSLILVSFAISISVIPSKAQIYTGDCLWHNSLKNNSISNTNSLGEAETKIIRPYSKINTALVDEFAGTFLLPKEIRERLLQLRKEQLTRHGLFDSRRLVIHLLDSELSKLDTINVFARKKFHDKSISDPLKLNYHIINRNLGGWKTSIWFEFRWDRDN